MNEFQFTKILANLLSKRISRLLVASHKSLLYSVYFDNTGNLRKHIDIEGNPKRGRGMGFEQDIVIYYEAKNADTSVVPLVVAEVKFEKIGSHSAMVYSEKAKRIRSIYPYVRYGLILGAMDEIPPRVLRLGPEFDFIFTLPSRISKARLSALVRKLKSESSLAKQLAVVLSGKKAISSYHRRIRLSAK